MLRQGQAWKYDALAKMASYCPKSDVALQVISLADYRAQLAEYLRNRMTAIAPNLTIMVGELVGARLIAHSGD